MDKYPEHTIYFDEPIHNPCPGYKIIQTGDLIDHKFNFLSKEQILELTHNVPFCVDVSREPANESDIIIRDTLLSYDFDDFYVFTSNYNYYKLNDKHLKFFPQTFLEPHFYNSWYKKLDTKQILNSNRKIPLMCFNARQRPHRIENFVLIQKKPWFNNLHFTMHQGFDPDLESRELPRLNFIDDTILPTFLSLEKHLPTLKYINAESINDIAYIDSYINFITETCVNGPYWYLSEKIWKPFQCGQFGIFLAYPGSVQHLRDIGFDVFDDYINHSYDTELDWHKRIEMLHIEIERLLGLDLPTIFESTKERRLYNYEHFYSDTLKHSLTDHLPWDSIKNCPKT